MIYVFIFAYFWTRKIGQISFDLNCLMENAQRSLAFGNVNAHPHSEELSIDIGCSVRRPMQINLIETIQI